MRQYPQQQQQLLLQQLRLQQQQGMQQSSTAKVSSTSYSSHTSSTTLSAEGVELAKLKKDHAELKIKYEELQKQKVNVTSPANQDSALSSASDARHWRKLYEESTNNPKSRAMGS